LSFRLLGIRVDISFYFFALLTAFFILEPDSATACGALAAVLHEFGHLAAMLIVPGGKVERISITACGLKITARLCGQFKGWLPVCAAGAAANFIAAITFIPLTHIGSGNFASVFSSANICVGVINLLPIEPMDGGQILRTVLLRFTVPERADRICCAVSFSVLLPFLCAGLWLLMQTRYNFSLLFLGLWLFGSVIEEYLS